MLIAIHDTLMGAASFAMAVYLRLGSDQIHIAEPYLFKATISFAVICAIIFAQMRLYRGLWRYASMRDMMVIVRAVTLAILVFSALAFIIDRHHGIPRSVPFINWMVLLLLLAGPRVLYRSLHDRNFFSRSVVQDGVKIPVMLVGVNDNAERFIRDMARDRKALYEVVAIADDDPRQKHHTLHRVPIYGGTDILDLIINKLERKGVRPQKIILTDDSKTGDDIRKLLDKVDSLGIPLARLPRSSEFKTRMHDRKDIQPIAVEDLLGRAQNVLDRASMSALVKGKRILVTGAGGTIGGELTRQIASYAPAEMVLLERSEFNMYQIDREIRGCFPDLELHVTLADVIDQTHVNKIFETYRPEIVFHAAAIKHVPLAEQNVEETVLTNVFGTRYIAEACKQYKTSVMVMISTDKAVNPTNVMGAAKRLAECFCQALGASEESSNTKFITVRFGNVLGSTGSVVPLFQEQIERGGPVTVTHPDMTRYFMTVREAVELVMQAASLGAGLRDRKECIFVLDMGRPMKILDLAHQMIRLAGLKPGEDIAITFTGLRQGEKLYEELFYLSENAVKTAHDNIFLASPRVAEMHVLLAGLEKLLAACKERKAYEVRALLQQLVPEFEPAVKKDHDHQARPDLRIVKN
ncbi:MAG: polysaccharide biosynthesis protein [Alphaproteobacteria bacterium]